MDGTGAPASTLGNIGDFYIDTTADTGYGPKTSFGWGAPINLIGSPGAPGTPGTNGTNGNSVLNGAGAPASTLGNVGDFYLDTAVHAIYGPKTASGWGNSTSLVGPQGTPGVSPSLSATTQSYSDSVPNDTASNLIYTCPSGDVDTGGGGGFATPSAGLAIQQSQPYLNGTTPTGWEMIVDNTSGATQTFNMYLICVPTSTGSASPAVRSARATPTVQLSPITP